MRRLFRAIVQLLWECSRSEQTEPITSRRIQTLLHNLQEVLHRGNVEIVVVLILSVIVFALIIGWFLLFARFRSLYGRLTALTRNADGASLEEAIAAHMTSVDEAVQRTGVLEQAVGKLETRLPACLQRVNLVRYDAFDDVGGEQSFAVALLDAHGDGVLLSSIYTRQDVRIYAKSISGGQASHTLSKEEHQALAVH
jgi:hypothetical protein